MVPLIVRSHYSLMRGTEPVERLVKRARRLGYRKLALTDTDNLYGLWPFLAACRREDITPIVGAELTEPDAGRRAVCLVENAEGYANLCRLITRRHMDEKRFSLAAVNAQDASGLIVLTSDENLLAIWHAEGIQTAAAMGRKPSPALHRHLVRTAARLGIPVVAAPDSYFGVPADIQIHRMLRAVDGNTSVSRLTPDDVAPADAWLAGPEEYKRRFAACPEALSATDFLAERLTFTGPSSGIVLPPWEDASGRDASGCLREAAYAGAQHRYGAELSEPVVDRLEHELNIIRQMGFSAYFLIVRDIVRQSPRICGRGSGAASLVAYCLGITNVCPVKHNLYFGRFLNPGRTDPPDIDIDFAWDERDDVLSAVLTKHRGHAAMVANHVCIQPRMAIREVAKVFGLTDREIGAVSQRLPGYWRSGDAGDGGLLARLKERPETGSMEFPPPWPEILKLAGRIVGAPRYLSVHSGGVVITPGPIDTYVPLQRAPKGVPIIQWEKEGAEDAGLVKIDLLGNRSLGVIRDAVANLRANGDVLDENRWEPEDDPETQEALAQGQTMGCFYIESPAMRLLQKKSRTGDFEHLVIHSSIIRPAANEFIQEYIRRLHGGPWDPIHPLLADVLSETFGIMVYQEDVSRTAVALAGFSDADADGLRKILSKKDRARHMEDFRERFFAGARSRGVSEEKIAEVWAMMTSFSGYSFCKPHSASYARVSFQAAYLKVHHPAEFMAAVISNQGGFYATFAYVSEARRMGLSVMPPDINESRDRWTGKDSRLRVGLLAVKGISADLRTRIVERRRDKGPYRSMNDFLQRTRPDEPEVRALIDAGALDALAPDGRRTALLWQLARFRETARKRPVARSLFEAPADDAPPPFPRKSVMDRLRREFSVLGFLCDSHPMALYAGALKHSGRIRAADLAQAVGRRIRMAGWLITGKKVRTKHGDTMEFLTFEDETGIAETVFFPDTYRRFCHLLDWGRPYLLDGKVEQDWGAVTLTVDGVRPIRPLR